MLQYYLIQWAWLDIIQFVNIKWTSKPVCLLFSYNMIILQWKPIVHFIKTMYKPCNISIIIKNLWYQIIFVCFFRTLFNLVGLFIAMNDFLQEPTVFGIDRIFLGNIRMSPISSGCQLFQKTWMTLTRFSFRKLKIANLFTKYLVSLFYIILSTLWTLTISIRIWSTGHVWQKSTVYFVQGIYVYAETLTNVFTISLQCFPIFVEATKLTFTFSQSSLCPRALMLEQSAVS